MKHIVLYDAQCYLCQQSKSIFQRLDWCHNFQWKSLQDYKKETNLSREEETAIKQEIHIIKRGGTKQKGYHAVVTMLRYSPPTAPIGLLGSLPGMSLVGKPLYSWIAKNRYKFFKGKCPNGSCNLHNRSS
ncbi:thiol-disulfide oxidoreductase DCC family protein [Thalassobacillus devorans]|uniref:thiol-disulfide oxidoreductase DCC family protein n=1 Tax=Thalassobacillus devorans TaxID=279813 RepID=UPI00048AFB4D|nr:DUF393 domain-containing protein [Thalassobacillus devorans]